MNSVHDDEAIARLLAEDYPDQDFGDDALDDSDDPDYGAELRRKASKKAAKRGRGATKKAAAVAAPAAQPAASQPAMAPAVQLRQQLAEAVSAQQQWQQQGQAGAVNAAALPAGQPAAMYHNEAGVPMQLPPATFALPPGISLQQAALMGLPLAMMPMAVQPAGKPGPGPGAASAAGGAEGSEELTATGRRKRKDTGKQRQHSRSWSEEEERRFLQALELHGRDWKKCAEHVGTRDHRAFTSHAQKHFIKLLLRGEEVPPKVAETGRGYTLSGKPLDPNSSSAAAYGLKPELFQAVCRTGRLQVGVHVTTFDMSDQPVGRKAGVARLQKTAGASPASSGPAAPAPQPKRQRKAKGRGSSDDEGHGTDEEAEVMAALAASSAVLPGQRTEYARNRPRREVGQRTRLGETTESLELTLPAEFVGPPGTGALAQPFAVHVESQALLVADFHAHLSRCEIIGLLGGTFDTEHRVMRITEAYPCRRVAGSDSSTSVELDAESQVEATSAMEERGLIPVGWYHSHPIFEPRPSAKDNENQRNYQALCRDLATGLEPWVGLIVGPYDLALESPASKTQLWVVKMKEGQPQPYNVRQTVTVGMPAPDVHDKIREALDQLQDDIGRVDLSELWRPFTTLVAGQPSGQPLTKIQKLRASLAQHLPRHDPAGVAAFLDEVTRSIEASWGVSLAAAVSAHQEPQQQHVGAAAGGDQAAVAAAAAALPPPKLEPVLAGATGAVPSGVSLPPPQQQLAFGGVPASMAQPGVPGVMLPAGVLAGGQMLMPPQGLPASGPCLPGMAQSLLPGGVKAEPVGGSSGGMGAPGLVLPPGGMTALLQGSMGPGDAGGLVITAAHHQLLGGAPAAVPVPAPAGQQ